MRRRQPLLMAALILSLIRGLANGPVHAQPLPELNIESGTVTVSGLSSGAFMAVQLQVAYSSSISGAGVVAGGPYGCADGSLWQALYVCMNPFVIKPDAADSVALIQRMAGQGKIDPVAGLLSDSVYLFHGRSDDTVDRASMDALVEMYRELGVPDESIEYVASVNAGHGFVTEQGSISCDRTRPDFLIDCDIDQAGDILGQLYGELSAPAPASELVDGLFPFDQSRYAEGAMGMDETAFLYVPAECARGQQCRLHIALHGCRQGREVIGDDYARLTGYNAWAETNRIVVLYPQAVRVLPPWYNWYGGNPNGCWDWWGYSGSDYLSRTSPQMSAIARASAALGVPLETLQ